MKTPRNANMNREAPSAEELRQLYGSMTHVELAKHYDISPSLLSKWLRARNVWNEKIYVQPNVREKHYSWKGDKAGYSAGHGRVRRHRGTPKKCEVCGIDDPKVWYEWANLTGKYYDVNDYRRMCRRCHQKHDRIFERQRGDLAVNAKLTEANVRDIRATYAQRSNTRPFSLQKQLAVQYGVARTTILGVVQNRTWKHLL